MADRFQELLSRLEQQITKSLAEARAMQSEPLSRFIHHRWRNRAPGMGARVIAGACCADWTGP
jgi:hypothetical protein